LSRVTFIRKKALNQSWGKNSIENSKNKLTLSSNYQSRFMNVSRTTKKIEKQSACRLNITFGDHDFPAFVQVWWRSDFWVKMMMIYYLIVIYVARNYHILAIILLIWEQSVWVKEDSIFSSLNQEVIWAEVVNVRPVQKQLNIWWGFTKNTKVTMVNGNKLWVVYWVLMVSSNNKSIFKLIFKVFRNCTYPTIIVRSSIYLNSSWMRWHFCLQIYKV
jgi:hypothetical protein